MSQDVKEQNFAFIFIIDVLYICNIDIHTTSTSLSSFRCVIKKVISYDIISSFFIIILKNLLNSKSFFSFFNRAQTIFFLHLLIEHKIVQMCIFRIIFNWK